MVKYKTFHLKPYMVFVKTWSPTGQSFYYISFGFWWGTGGKRKTEFEPPLTVLKLKKKNIFAHLKKGMDFLWEKFLLLHETRGVWHPFFRLPSAGILAMTQFSNFHVGNFKLAAKEIFQECFQISKLGKIFIWYKGKFPTKFWLMRLHMHICSIESTKQRQQNLIFIFTQPPNQPACVRGFPSQLIWSTHPSHTELPR